MSIVTFTKFKYILLAFFVLILAIVAIGAVLIPPSKNFQQPTSKASNQEQQEASFTLISTGDIGLVRDINWQVIKNQDPSLPFVKIAPYLKDADITITNLEGPLLKNCPIVLTGFKFCGQEQNVAGLVFSGIDAANLANNHSTNFGLEGLDQTAKSLESNGVIPFGLEDQIEYIEIRGQKIALVGFIELGANWPGLNNATVDNVAKLISTAQDTADIVIVAFHWGNEYTRKPTPNQVLLAHTAVDSGADIILGNHSHWIGEVEIYKDVFIIYSQGNTIFDQDWSQETKEGVVYKFEYKQGKFTKIDEKYTIIEENFQPRFATEAEAVKIKSKL